MIKFKNTFRWVRAHQVRATVGMLATIGTIAIVIYTLFPPTRDWIYWQFSAGGMHTNELTILISRFRYDPDGRFTSEVEAGLLRQGWELVRFRRTLTAEELIESSRTRSASELDSVERLFERHGGDVLLTGEVSASGEFVRIRLFEKGGNSAVSIELDLRTEWTTVLAPHVERAILTSLLRSSSYRANEYDDEFIRRVLPIESKALELAERASSDTIQNSSIEFYRELSIEIGMNLGDASRLTAAREQSEIRLSRLSDSDSLNGRIAALWDVADLSRTESLVLGDMELLDRSFVLSREIRRLLEVPEDDFIYPNDFIPIPAFINMLEIESSIALACRDLQRIDELLEIYKLVASCSTDQLDISCPLWSSRAIFALRYGRGAWSISDLSGLHSAAYIVDNWARIVGYRGRTQFWADPMTHANRLLRARLRIGSNANFPPFSDALSNILTSPEIIPNENACPNLIRLMTLPIKPA